VPADYTCPPGQAHLLTRIIREQGGHYLLAGKDNRPTLRAAVEAAFERACEPIYPR
jgi:hypothetical protein